MALNSVGFNIARAVGPALGGIVMAAAGAKATVFPDQRRLVSGRDRCVVEMEGASAGGAR